MSTEQTLYTVRDVARIFGLNESRVRYWAQTGFINPSGQRGGRRLYTFNDLVGIKAARELLDRGIPLQRVRRNLHALREALPDVAQPLARLRVRSDGDELVVEQQEGAFEPTSGQMVLDFEVHDLRHDVAQVLELQPPRRPTTPRARAGDVRLAEDDEEAGIHDPTTAYGWFMRGCQLDVDGDRAEDAIAAYSRAIELDPGLAAAQTNLGNVHYRRGERERARSCYEQACAVEPEQPQAHYNLANLYEEEGDLEMAIAEYRRALAADPEFVDAHFNLAMTLEALGSRRQACAHWRKFVAAVEERGGGEESEWLAIAHERIAELEHRAE